MPATTRARTDERGRPLCEARKGDNTECWNLGTHTIDGVRYCGVHVKKLAERQEQVKADLKRYREYQTLAFGALACSWPIEALQGRLATLKRKDHSDDTDLHSVRLQAEEAAITRELARRKGATT